MLRAITGILLVLLTAPSLAGPLRVVTSFSILEDWVTSVGGNHVNVISLVGRNGNAHTFRPSPADVKAISTADLIVINGLKFEAWLVRLLEAANYGGRIVIASKGAQLLHIDSSHTHNHTGENIDPHAWHSTSNAIHYIRNIEQALFELDPQNANDYRANASQYISQISSLRAEYLGAFDRIAPAQRKLVASHAGFAYLTQEYGIELLSPESGSGGFISSARRIANLIDRIRREKIQAVFLENTTDPRLLDQISVETGVVVGGRLYSDALSPTDGEAPTYLKMMRHNLDTIFDVLEGGGQ